MPNHTPQEHAAAQGHKKAARSQQLLERMVLDGKATKSVAYEAAPINPKTNKSHGKIRTQRFNY